MLVNMSRFIFNVFFIILISNYGVESARILGVFPVPSVSHQVVFRALIDKLAERGHDIVTVTPNPVNDTRKNVKEIDTSYTYKIFEQAWRDESLTQYLKRGVISDPSSMNTDMYKLFNAMIELTYKNQELQNLLKNNNEKFDVIITEALFSYSLVLPEILKAPLIWISSLSGTIENFHAVGAPYQHWMIYPTFYRTKLFNLTIEEKFSQLYIEYKQFAHTNNLLYHQDLLLKEHYPEVKKSVYELMDNVDMLFLNANPIFEGNRPVPPNVIYLGAVHMKSAKNLTKEWQDYLDSSERGVVYISLGTNVRTDMMPPDLVEAFVGAIEALPYDVLWKVNIELPRKPKNLRIEKWFPQRDLLLHPNIKAFVTQGGLQSTDEAIDSGVPLVGIPMLGDQWYNVEQYVRLGIGVKVDPYTFDADDLYQAVMSVIDDPSYRENMVRLRTLMNDQPQSPLERAVWWTEYVIRHKGAKHLKATTANMSWWTYLEVELLSVIFGGIVVVVLALIGLLLVLKKLVCQTLCKKSVESANYIKVKKS